MDMLEGVFEMDMTPTWKFVVDTLVDRMFGWPETPVADYARRELMRLAEMMDDVNAKDPDEKHGRAPSIEFMQHYIEFVRGPEDEDEYVGEFEDECVDEVGDDLPLFKKD